ncbi:hypothetical protein H4R21_004164, partial [Coemansia helicoidea]
MMLQLLEEVKALIDVYATVFNPVDKMEWSLVVKEMSLFMQAMCSPVPTDGGLMLPVSHRLAAHRRARADKDGARLRLQEAVVVGNRPKQTKFSDMTLDMHYMLQLLEREPSAPPPPLSAAATTAATTTATTTAAPPTEAAPTTATTAEASITELADAVRPPEAPKPRPEELEKAARRTNPHKHMLYLPSIGQIQVYLASAFREIGDQGCVLLYLSSDGARADDGTGAAQHGFTGGVSTARRPGPEAGQDRGIEQLVNTVHPADLVPFTRKPFFLVVESESSAAYRAMPNLFNQPLLCLLSPTEYPAQVGVDSAYTLFLHSPAVAFCVLSRITAMGAARWADLDQRLAAAEDAALALAAVAMPPGARRFLGDDFLRQIIARHVLCCAVLRLHVDFARPEHWPQASPECLADVAADPGLVSGVRELIALCEAEQLYRMADAPSRPPSPPSPPPAPAAARAKTPPWDRLVSHMELPVDRAHPLLYHAPQSIGMRDAHGPQRPADGQWMRPPHKPVAPRETDSVSATADSAPSRLLPPAAEHGMSRGSRAPHKRRTVDDADDRLSMDARRRRVDEAAPFPWPSESTETLPTLEPLSVSDTPSTSGGPSPEPRRSGRRRVQRVQLVGTHLAPEEPAPPRRRSRRQAPAADPEPAQERGAGSRARRSRRVTSSSEGSSAAGTPRAESALGCDAAAVKQGPSAPRGRATAAGGETATCPFCNKELAGTAEEINTHANDCLDNGGGGGRMESYVFDGVERVRVTALFTGSLEAQFGTSSAEQAADEDIDVDQQDESSYGAPQYTDADLAISEAERARAYNTSHLRTDADPQAEYEPEPPN